MDDSSKPACESSEQRPREPERSRDLHRIDLAELLRRLEQAAEEHRRTARKQA